MGRPYGLLRAGFPYVKTLGMRRVTDFPVDLAIGADETMYVICRSPIFAQISRLTQEDENLGAIGGFGTDDGKFQLPAGIAIDREQNLWVSDEALHRITVLTTDGEFVTKWGEHGDADGQLDRPSGIAFDADENLYVVDTMNHRVQKFSKNGDLVLGWGRHGVSEGEFNMPWGIAVDDLGDVYVAAWRNDRVQKFTTAGKFLSELGSTGSEKGEFNRPAGVAVDSHGDIYVADCGNDRVQHFSPEGRYVKRFLGNATLSRSGRQYMMANAIPNRLREMADLEPQEKFRQPKSVKIDQQLRMYVVDFGSYRIQVYQKDAIPLSPEQLAPPLRSPTLLVQ